MLCAPVGRRLIGAEGSGDFPVADTGLGGNGSPPYSVRTGATGNPFSFSPRKKACDRWRFQALLLCREQIPRRVECLYV